MDTKKDRVIEIATQLFAERGYENTSMATICEKAKVSKGLIYHHFKSKEAILIEIFTQTTDEMVQMNDTSEIGVVPSEQLIKLIETIFERLQKDKLFFQLQLNIMFQPSTRNLLQEQIKERAAILYNSVLNIFEKISPTDSVEKSYLFIAEMDGIALNYLSVFEEYPLEAIKEQLIKKYQTN